MGETTNSLTRVLIAFLFVLLGMSLIYPEGFNAIVDAFTQNIQLIFLLFAVWFILSVLKKKGD